MNVKKLLIHCTRESVNVETFSVRNTVNERGSLVRKFELCFSSSFRSFELNKVGRKSLNLVFEEHDHKENLISFPLLADVIRRQQFCKVVCLQIIYLKVTYSLPQIRKFVKNSRLLVAILCTCSVMKVNKS